MTALIWTANLLGWPVLHLSVAYSTLRLPSGLFARDTWLTAPRAWERDGKLLSEVVLHPQMETPASRWRAVARRLSQEEAPLRAIPSTCRNSCLKRAVPKSRIGACLRPAGILLLESYMGTVGDDRSTLSPSNLPCIIVQRYNRLALERAVRTRGRAQVRP